MSFREPKVISDWHIRATDRREIVDIFYYILDDILADNHDKIIENRGDFVGKINLNDSGLWDEDNTIFVENFDKNVIYMVTKINRRFTQKV